LANPAPAASPAIPDIGLRLQVFLDRKLFAPGKLDGQSGEFTQKALDRYKRVLGLTGPGYSDLLYELTAIEPLCILHVLSADDLAWVSGPLPAKISARATLKRLPYESVLEYLAERYHSDPKLLLKLNPGLNPAALHPGDSLRVPNVEPFRIETLVIGAKQPADPALAGRTVNINTATRQLEVLTPDRRLVALFPITPGSPELPAPKGDWRILGIVTLPTFRWDEGVLNRGVRTENFFMLKPGPNNPVGILWTGLNKPGIGIHGTSTPDTIGRSQSHGCIRLANWDAARFRLLVTEGVKVHIE
jgi:lipoprotein-anchoring transpeptidase ErfK/SrfK